MNSDHDRIGEEVLPAPKPVSGYVPGAPAETVPLRSCWNQLMSYKDSCVGLSGDMLSVGASQALAAIGQIIGIRLLTEALSPTVFGEIALIVGASMLATSVLINPTMQALLRYYPECAQSGEGALAERMARRRILSMLWWALPLSLPLLLIGLVQGWFGPVAALLLLLLAAIDGMKMFRTTVMNATRQHHRYGLWLVGEAWGRPLLAYGATLWLGIQVELVLIAYIVVSLALYASLSHSIDPHAPTTVDRNVQEGDLLRRFEAYARPLIPLGVVGWVSSMGDRYMIGSLLSAQSVGMYAAAYSLASRPLLMLSSIAETSIRPVYYDAVARQDRQASRKYLVVWLVLVLAGGVAACALLTVFHRQLAGVLLGAEFREGSYLMPWVAAGYGLLALSHVTTRICYANDATRSVLTTETAGALCAVVIGFPLIYAVGLKGAAMAVPLYFGIQLLLSAYLARQACRVLLPSHEQK
jgi:O-antigen/teichoic acid export membrane protein